MNFLLDTNILVYYIIRPDLLKQFEKSMNHSVTKMLHSNLL